jgi:predicted phosphodiesterase
MDPIARASTILRSNPARRTRRILRVLLPIVVGLVGAWLGMALWGSSTVDMGPFVVRLDTQFGRGFTDIVLPPLGQLRVNTHTAPLRLNATLLDVRVTALSHNLADGGLDGLVTRVEADARHTILVHAFRTIAVATAGALLLGLLIYRERWTGVASTALAAFIIVVSVQMLALATFRPDAFGSPTFSGSLRLAADIIPPVEGAATKFDEFRTQLERVVDGAIKVYTSIQTNPVGAPGEIRVLHVSDIHLSPLGFEFARQLAEGFDVNFVLDTGDTTSFGTPPENAVLNDIRDMGKPYVWVRGNHDSRIFQAALAKLPNTRVLDGDTTVEGGLRIYGIGDPVKPPTTERLSDSVFATRVFAVDPQVLAGVQSSSQPVDIVAVHDDRMAESVAGHVPLVLSGHFHDNESHVVNGTLYLRVGTTGGSNFATFLPDQGIPLSAEVLYFEPGAAGARPTLVAYDLIEQSPKTGALTVTRHLIQQEFGTLIPSPSPTSTPSPSVSPAVSGTAAAERRFLPSPRS